MVKGYFSVFVTTVAGRHGRDDSVARLVGKSRFRRAQSLRQPGQSAGVSAGADEGQPSGESRFERGERIQLRRRYGSSR